MIKRCISQDWLFRSAEPGAPSNADAYARIDLPHDYLITKKRSPHGTGDSGNGYYTDERGRYVKYLTLDGNRRYILDVDGAYMLTEVFLNENHLALHPYGYTPFLVDLTDYVLPGKTNKLVMVTNPPPKNARWYSGNGIYRDVFLWEGGDIRIEPWDLFVATESADAQTAKLRIRFRVKGERASELTVRFFIGELMECFNLSLPDTGSVESEYIFTIPSPRLWNPDHPNLYVLKTELWEEGVIRDTTQTQFGIRTLSVDANNGMLLNGKPIKLRGGCIHHDHGVLGAAAFPAAEARKIRLLKEAGFNALRIAHNPPSLALLECCDRMGMIVMDEAFDVWNKGKPVNGYHLFFRDWWARDIASMVLRDRNHPCVFSYSIGNEIFEVDGTSDAPKLSKMLSDEVRKYDSTRPVTSGICKSFARRPYQKDPEPESLEPADYREYLKQRFAAPEQTELNRITAAFEEPLDIIGVNYFHKHYLLEHEAYPKRVIWGSETQALHFYDSWNLTKNHNCILGDFTWNAFDNMGETGTGRGWWSREEGSSIFHAEYPWRTCYQGDLDLCGFRRPQSYFREAVWLGSTEPRIFVTHPEHFGEEYLGTGWRWPEVLECWTFPDIYVGRPVTVETYTDAEKILWFVNGEAVGETVPEKGIAKLNTFYRKGSITAAAWKNGVEVSRFTLESTQTPSALQVVPECSTFLADNRDLCYFDIAVTDRDGKLDALASQEIACTVIGGELLGIFSGDPKNEDQYGSNLCHVFRGRALAIVRTKVPGTVIIKVYADTLAPGYAEVIAE